MSALLDVQGLEVEYRTRQGPLRAVDGLSFTLQPGETLALVGESGCGKSTAALALMRLASSAQARIGGRALLLEGEDLLQANDARMRELRGGRMAMIFQDPSMYLNPVYTVGDQIVEAIRLHQSVSSEAARRQAVELLGLVGVPAPAQRVGQYPHDLSGGMRQRVMIAMALACQPRLLIADEPTTALDVTIQAQVLELIARLKRQLGMAVLLITHDLGVVAETADRLVVMYAGRKVEEGSVAEVFAQPRHPYTQGLLRAASWSRLPDRTFFEIAGTVPSLAALPAGCRFAPRCDQAQEACRAAAPPAVRLGPRREVECVRVEAAR
ncbi:MAG: ABC transporter ATP-binding protein [Rubrivivax sp.]